MKISFSINYRTEWGETLYISGSIPALGSGQPDKAVAMRELIDAVTDDDRFISALSQTGWGMLIATLQ